MSKTILVSAGHSTIPPKDPGAIGFNYHEADIALRMRDAVAARLRAQGCQVIEDGSDGVNEPLTKAIALARTASIAVEFHLNAGPPDAGGIEVLSKPNKSALARKIALAIHQATGSPLRGGNSGWMADNSGQHHRLGFCEAGGLIVELCFISNKSDLDKLLNNFDTAAEAIAEELAAEAGVFAPTAPTTSTGQNYTVVSGDTLSAIARKLGTTVEALENLNNLKSDVLQIGQILKVK